MEEGFTAYEQLVLKSPASLRIKSLHIPTFNHYSPYLLHLVATHLLYARRSTARSLGVGRSFALFHCDLVSNTPLRDWKHSKSTVRSRRNPIIFVTSLIDMISGPVAFALAFSKVAAPLTDTPARKLPTAAICGDCVNPQPRFGSEHLTPSTFWITL